MKCIIPCAGESSRMSYVPKHLITINGEPLLHHVINSWKDKVDSFIFTIKRSMTYMWEFLPENAIVVFQDEPKGLADAILQAEKCVSGKFIVTLGDCLFKGSFAETEFDLGIGVWKTNNVDEVLKSYLVTVTNSGNIAGLEEKPKIAPQPSNCGMGTYFFDTRLFDYIRAYKGQLGGGDLTHIMQNMIDAGEKISPVWFRGDYINIGSPEDIRKAEEMLK